MKRPKPRRCLWLGLFLVAPPAFWALLLALVPTDWARARLVARLEQATHRRVSIASVRLGPFGGVKVGGLEIGEPQPDQPPWLVVRELRVDINLVSLISGTCGLTDVQADGVTLRIHRRPDGTFEFADLLSSPASADPGAAADGTAAEEHPPVTFRLGELKLAVIDDPSDTHLEFLGVEAKGSWQRRKAAVEELKGELNGGHFEMVGQLDRGELGGPAFEGQLRATGVGLGMGMKALSYLLPVVAGMPSQVDGKLDLDLDLRGQGATAAAIERTLVGRGAIALDPLLMDGSKVVAELANALHLSANERVGSIRSDFEIRAGRISSKDLTIRLGRVPIPLAGWTDFSGRVDYRARPEGLAGKVPAGVQGLLADLSVDASDLATLRVQGTVAELGVSVDGVPISGKGAGDLRQNPEARARLKEAARRLRNRIIR